VFVTDSVASEIEASTYTPPFEYPLYLTILVVPVPRALIKTNIVHKKVYFIKK